MEDALDLESSADMRAGSSLASRTRRLSHGSKRQSDLAAKAELCLGREMAIYPGVYLPNVIQLLVYKHVLMRLQVTAQRNILLRDGCRCQYCGVKFHGSDLTLDHIVFRARGAKTTWENLVACCHRDNHRRPIAHRKRRPCRCFAGLFLQACTPARSSRGK
jgi:hypothetical protein